VWLDATVGGYGPPPTQQRATPRPGSPARHGLVIRPAAPQKRLHRFSNRIANGVVREEGGVPHRFGREPTGKHLHESGGYPPLDAGASMPSDSDTQLHDVSASIVIAIANVVGIR
jgi:hypothetical protein